MSGKKKNRPSSKTDWSHPVDHGWSWMCCVGAFVCMFFITGGLRSVGLLFVEFVEVFDASRGLTAVTLGLMSAGFAIFVPLANGLGARFTFRNVAIVGGTLAAIAAFLTAFAPNIIYVICVLGILTGVGQGLMWGPSLVMVGQHFRKRRSLANGIAAAGGSVGQLVLPQLISFLLATYNFKGALLIFSAITLNTLPAASLFRPLSSYKEPIGSDKNRSTPFRRNNYRSMSFRSKRGQKPQVAEVDFESEVLYPLDCDIPDICPYEEGLVAIEEEPQVHPLDEELPELPELSNGVPKDPDIVAPPHEPTENPTVQDPDPEDRSPNETSEAKGCCSKAFQWSLFKNWLFVIYVLGLSLGNCGYLNLCMFLPPYAIDNGLDKQRAAILLSIAGISDLVGRLLGGFLADFEFMKRSNMMAVSLILTGAAALALPLTPTFPWFVGYSVILGGLGGMYVSLMAVVAVDFLGVSRLASVIGLATMCFGLAIIPVPVVLGVVRDITGSYDPAQWTCGILMILGGLSFAMEPLARKREGQ